MKTMDSYRMWGLILSTGTKIILLLVAYAHCALIEMTFGTKERYTAVRSCGNYGITRPNRYL